MARPAGLRLHVVWLIGIAALLLVGAVACFEAASPATPTSPAVPTAEVASPTVVPTPTPTATPMPTATATPIPTPTAVPPTPTPTPTPAPACVLNPPDIDLPSSRPEDEAWRFLEDLTTHFSPRESGTAEEYQAGEELKCLLEEMGYETYFQGFSYMVDTISSVVVDADAHPDLAAILSYPIRDSAGGEATAELVYVGLALEDDIGDKPLDGKIALIERGMDTFQAKTERVEAAGAVAAVIFNNAEGLFEGIMINRYDVPSIPAISISREDGLALLDAIEDGGLEAEVAVSGFYEVSVNLIAEMPGGPGREGVFILGAHFDTVHFTEGANDNGSGVTALLAIAGHIIEREYPFTVRLLLFGAEEVGLRGSRHYVEQLTERERWEIIGMINFDSPGSGDTLEAQGDLSLTLAAVGVSEREGILLEDHLARGTSSSDHRPFQAADIPAIIVTGNDISRINSSADTLGFVDPQLVAWAAEIGIGILEHLAVEWGSEG